MPKTLKLPPVTPLPRWRTLLARWLITGKRRLSECSIHYDEYGMPTSNIVGCIWCALHAYQDEVSRLRGSLARIASKPADADEARARIIFDYARVEAQAALDGHR